MTFDELTVATIAQSVSSALRFAAQADSVKAQSALERAEQLCARFTAGRPSHQRAVRVARELVTGARSAVTASTSRERSRYTRATVRAVARLDSRP